MNTKADHIEIANVDINIVRKDIKNMHLAVYPPNGRIRLSAPLRTDDEVLRLFAISKLPWIKKHVKNFKSQARETIRTYTSGESHYLWGKRYILNVKHHRGFKKIYIKGSKYIDLKIKPEATQDDKGKAIKEWYRKELKRQLPEIIQKWEKIIGVEVDDWGVKQMRTKWGACNPDAKRIWVNLELLRNTIARVHCRS